MVQGGGSPERNAAAVAELRATKKICIGATAQTGLAGSWVLNPKL